MGKYEILAPIAAGGMARIYIARTKGIGDFERHVVLKMILPERASDKHSVDMFLDEARLAAALNHQNVAQVFEVGQEGGNHYLAMEYVHGQDLRAVLAKAGQTGTRIPIELALAIVAGAAAGLHHAHDRRSPDGAPLGIVHRDVSPSNIMIGYDGAVKLLDFGIAKASARSVETQSGIIKGKFAYMSPEQCRGREVDRRSDVFSLGIILYEITTQHRCFRADSDFDTMHRIVTGDVVRPSRLVAGYPAQLEKIVMTALATDPARRYPSCSALLEDIEAFASQSRLSPSTMALGRFMRELFGEVLEPWQTAGRGSSPVVAAQPRENTVSNTLDSQAFSSLDSDEPSQQVVVSGGDTSPPRNGWEPLAEAAAASPDPWPRKEPSRSSHTWAAKPSSRARAGAQGGPTPTPMKSVAAAPQTLLDLPRGGQEAEDAVDWDAKAYPQAQPTFASQLDVPVERKPPEGGMAPLSLSVVAPLRVPTDSLRDARDPSLSPTGVRRGFGKAPTGESNRPAAMSQGMVPQLAAMPDNKTSTAAAAAALPLSSRAFASGEGSQSAQSRPIADPISDPGLESRGRHRLLVPLLIAALLIGGAALLLVMRGGSGAKAESPRATESSTESPTESSTESGPASPVTPAPQPTAQPAAQPPTEDGPSAAATATIPSEAEPAPGAEPAAAEGPLRTVEATLHLQVSSDPKGAEVYLDGKRLGVTPLSVFLPKERGSATLMVRRSRYVDASAKIDLSSAEVNKSFSLRKVPGRAPSGDDGDAAKAQRCQRPENANPFDDAPICPQ